MLEWVPKRLSIVYTLQYALPAPQYEITCQLLAQLQVYMLWVRFNYLHECCVVNNKDFGIPEDTLPTLRFVCVACLYSTYPKTHPSGMTFWPLKCTCTRNRDALCRLAISPWLCMGFLSEYWKVALNSIKHHITVRNIEGGMYSIRRCHSPFPSFSLPYASVYLYIIIIVCTYYSHSIYICMYMYVHMYMQHRFLSHWQGECFSNCLWAFGKDFACCL